MRAPALDLLRATAAVMVVLLHVAALTLINPATPPGEWLAAHALDSLCRPAVPLFVMLTGALLLPAAHAGASFLRRRLRRLALPLLLAAGTYCALRLTEAPLPGLRTLAGWLLGGSVWYHLWYLYMLPGLTVLLAALAPLLARAAPGARQALCVALLVATAAATLAGVLPAPTLLRGGEFLGYALAGHLLWQGRHGLRAPAALALAALAGACLAAIFLAGALGEAWTGVSPRLNSLYAYTQPLVMLAALSLFRLALACPARAPGLAAAAWLAPLSLNLYLVHPAVLWALARWAPPLGLPLRAAFTLAGSLALCVLVQRLSARAAPA